MLIDWQTPSEFPTLAGEAVHVWAVPLDRVSVAESSLAGVLSAAELARADGFLVDRPRRVFTATRFALRSILGRYLGVAPGDVPLVVGPRGKPQLANGDLRFNAAHSGDLAVIVVTRGCEVGVDVEQVRPVERAAELAVRFFHRQEQAAVLAVDTAESSRALLSIWTRKEAVLKAVGSGIVHPLSTFDTTAANDDGRIDLPAHPPQSAMPCWLHSIEVIQGYAAAIASLAPRQPLLGFTYSL